MFRISSRCRTFLHRKWGYLALIWLQTIELSNFSSRVSQSFSILVSCKIFLLNNLPKLISTSWGNHWCYEIIYKNIYIFPVKRENNGVIVWSNSKMETANQYVKHIQISPSFYINIFCNFFEQLKSSSINTWITEAAITWHSTEQLFRNIFLRYNRK